jgi:4-amino-4-deoxy-L-arabinose transferase-like glycosyltransferase
MIETTEYAEKAGPPFLTFVREPATPRSRGGFWRGLDGFDWICIAALLLTFVALSHLPFGPSKFSDIYFHEEAKQLVRVVKGLDPWTEIRIARAPAPVFYYAIPYLAVPTGSPEETFWRFAVSWNALWMMISLLLIRRAGQCFGGETTGKVAAVLSLVLPFAAYYSFGISSEPPAYAAAVVFAYGWARWRRASQLLNRDSLIALAGMVGLFLCRPNAIVVLGIAGACGAALWKSSSWRRLLDMRFAAMCVSVGLVSVLLVSILIQHLPDKRGVRLQATNFSDVMFFGNFQFRQEPWDWRFWGKATRAGSVDYQNWVDTRNELSAESERSGVPLSRLQMQWSLRDIIHHPLERLKMSAVRALALNIWMVNSTSPDRFRFGILPSRAGFLLFHICLNAVALLPLFAAIWFLAANRREFFAYWPLWGPWLSLLLFHAVVYAEPRYMLPGQAGETILAACLIARAMERRAPISIGSRRGSSGR